MGWQDARSDAGPVRAVGRGETAIALTPTARKIGGELKNFQTPSNKFVPVPPGAPDLGSIKLINYDFAKYGGAAERKRILEKWDKEVY